MCRDKHLLGPEAKGHEAPIFVSCLVLEGKPKMCDFRLILLDFSVCFFMENLSGWKEVGFGQ